MASSVRPLVVTLYAGGTIVAGHAVKFGADGKHVVECTASTDLAIGIALSGTTTSGDPVEVAVSGGGAKAVCHASVSKGQFLAPFTDGTLNASLSNKDVIVAQAHDDGVAGDLIPVMVVNGFANI